MDAAAGAGMSASIAPTRGESATTCGAGASEVTPPGNGRPTASDATIAITATVTTAEAITVSRRCAEGVVPATSIA